VRGGENDVAPAEAAGARWITRSARLRKLATREPGLQRKTGLKSFENFKEAITLTLFSLFYTQGSGIVVLHVTAPGHYRFSLYFLKHRYKILGRYAKNWNFQQNNILQYYFSKSGHGYRCIK
jgi:hypothetical protein